MTEETKMVTLIRLGKALQEVNELTHNMNQKWWTNINTGEYPIPRNIGELLMLTVTELAEALEGHRKTLNDDKLPQYRMFDVEIVDATIRLQDIAGALIPDFADIWIAKMLYNSTREDHKVENRLKPGGKKY